MWRRKLFRLWQGFMWQAVFDPFDERGKNSRNVCICDSGGLFSEGGSRSFSRNFSQRGYALWRGPRLYSNEAGEGSAAVLHSSADVDHPVRQGLCGIIEVFVDTMISAAQQALQF